MAPKILGNISNLDCPGIHMILAFKRYIGSPSPKVVVKYLTLYLPHEWGKEKFLPLTSEAVCARW